MKKMGKWVIGLLVILLTLTIFWLGVKLYFSTFHPIANQVRASVYARAQSNGTKLIAYNQIPQLYRNAVIETEDSSFFQNKGVTLVGITRAIFVDLSNGEPLQGGSSITQQLVHNTILNNQSKTIFWKFKEIVYAIGLYDTMSKQETFALYANDIYFGHGAYGLYAAAITYFGRPPSVLNSGELTLLAGLPNAPSAYDPYKHMKLARSRQKHVVERLVETHVVTQKRARKILEEPIRLKNTD